MIELSNVHIAFLDGDDLSVTIFLRVRFQKSKQKNDIKISVIHSIVNLLFAESVFLQKI